MDAHDVDYVSTDGESSAGIVKSKQQATKKRRKVIIAQQLEQEESPLTQTTLHHNADDSSSASPRRRRLSPRQEELRLKKQFRQEAWVKSQRLKQHHISFKYAQKLANQKNTCVSILPEHEIHVAIHCSDLADWKAAVVRKLRQTQNFYDAIRFKGVLLAFSSPLHYYPASTLLRLQERYVFVRVRGTFAVFRPALGEKLNGVVAQQAGEMDDGTPASNLRRHIRFSQAEATEIDDDAEREPQRPQQQKSIDLLVYKLFNAHVRLTNGIKAEDGDDSVKPEEELAERTQQQQQFSAGNSIKFTVTNVTNSNGLLMIYGQK